MIVLVLLAGPVWSQAIDEDRTLQNGVLPEGLLEEGLASQKQAARSTSSSPQQGAEPASPASEPRLSPPTPNSGTTEIEAGFNYENLTRGYAPWRQATFLVIHRFTQRKVIYGTIEETNRFSRNDTEGMAGFYYPLSKQWTGLLEASVSPTHSVLPTWSLLGQIERAFGRRWGAQAGLRHREYDTATVDISNFGVEKYIKHFRFAYTLYAVHLQQAGFSTTHRIDANYYYGNSAVNLTLAAGRELENIIPAGVVPSKVKVVNFGGTHWFARDWAVSYSLSWYEQAPFYIRQGLTIGLRYRLQN